MTAIIAAEPATCAGVSTESRLAWGAAVVASLALHTALLAAALADPTPQTPPEPLVVELIGGGGGAPGGSGSAPGSASGTTDGTAGTAASTPGPQGAATGRSVAPAEAEPAPAEVKPAPAEAEAAPATTSLPLRQPQPRPRANTVRNSPPMTDTTRQPQRHEHRTPPPAPTAVSQDSMTRDAASPQLTQNAASDTVTDVMRNTASSSDTGHSSRTAGAGGAGESGSSGQGGSSGSGPSRGPGFAFGSAGNPIPSYPPAARRRGIEGTVLLLARVSADGRALAVEITHSSGSSLLDETARNTIARWHFRPALRNGAAVAGSVTIPVQFSLRNG